MMMPWAVHSGHKTFSRRSVYKWTGQVSHQVFATHMKHKPNHRLTRDKVMRLKDRDGMSKGQSIYIVGGCDHAKEVVERGEYLAKAMLS